MPQRMNQIDAAMIMLTRHPGGSARIRGIPSPSEKRSPSSESTPLKIKKSTPPNTTHTTTRMMSKPCYVLVRSSVGGARGASGAGGPTRAEGPGRTEPTRTARALTSVPPAGVTD